MDPLLYAMKTGINDPPHGDHNHPEDRGHRLGYFGSDASALNVCNVENILS